MGRNNNAITWYFNTNIVKFKIMEQEKFNELIRKVEGLKTSGTVDLSTEEDLSIAIMNLISLEEHFYFSAEKTKKDEYINLLMEVREVRKKLLARMMPVNEGESWCISKHLLGATMRMIEVGVKNRADKKDKEAKEIFDQAYRIYSLFWALRLKIIDPKNIKSALAEKDKNWSTEDIINKLVNCCDE